MAASQNTTYMEVKMNSDLPAYQNPTSDPEKPPVTPQLVEMSQEVETSQDVGMPQNVSNFRIQQSNRMLMADASSSDNTKYATIKCCCCSYPTPTLAKFVTILCLICGIYDIGISSFTYGLASLIYVLIFIPVIACLFYGVFKSSHSFTIPYIVAQVLLIVVRIIVIIVCIIVLSNFEYYFRQSKAADFGGTIAAAVAVVVIFVFIPSIVLVSFEMWCVHVIVKFCLYLTQRECRDSTTVI
ncbi:hypothetical protein AB6A40_007934 [Gnathostoma spinigerum]|uniref:Transmembrane protein n=1 Tax=Gnathostoma spinigerum TaxID=75299 RepID=A0ABD6EYA0_9BILA